MFIKGVKMEKEVFIIMPFSDTKTCTKAQWTEIFEDVFKPAFKEINYTCERAEPEIGSLIKSIVKKLYKSPIVLADITDRNANVFYELGVRHSLSLRTIIVTQNADHIPSDLKGYWSIVYSITPGGVSKFKQEIKELVIKIENNQSYSDNPVSDFLNDELHNTHNGIKIMNITDAMNYALNSFSHLKQLSIFAISTSKSVAFFRGKPDLIIDKLDLLLREYSINDMYYNSELENQINTSISRWTKFHQDGNIKKLNIYRYKFHPNNTFFLFDDSIVIIGNIHLKENYLVESDSNVIVANDTTELGKEIIRIYQRKFERLLQLVNNIPDIVDIEITNKCNLDCIYCFGPEYSNSDKDMPLDFWYSVLDFLSRTNCKCVVISGGEPTLYPYLIDVLKFAKNKGLSVLLATNGLDEQTIIQCSLFCDIIALPLDACENELCFKLRGINRGIQDLINLVRKIKEVNDSVKIRIGSVVTSLNYESLSRLAENIKLYASNDIDIWKIYQYAARRKKLKNADILNI
jgi:pyruvate-formate lyase-activating enzyme